MQWVHSADAQGDTCAWACTAWEVPAGPCAECSHVPANSVPAELTVGGVSGWPRVIHFYFEGGHWWAWSGQDEVPTNELVLCQGPLRALATTDTCGGSAGMGSPSDSEIHWTFSLELLCHTFFTLANWMEWVQKNPKVHQPSQNWLRLLSAISAWNLMFQRIQALRSHAFYEPWIMQRQFWIQEVFKCLSTLLSRPAFLSKSSCVLQGFCS